MVARGEPSVNGARTRWRVWSGWWPTEAVYGSREEAEGSADSVNKRLEVMGSTLRLTVHPEEEEGATWATEDAVREGQLPPSR